jgi:hypothetical protein
MGFKPDVAPHGDLESLGAVVLRKWRYPADPEILIMSRKERKRSSRSAERKANAVDKRRSGGARAVIRILLLTVMSFFKHDFFWFARLL